MSDKYPTPPELLTPGAQATINASITAAIREMFQQMGPIFEKTALTEDKLRTALKPYVDPAVIAREQREKALMAADLAEAERQRKQLQASCSHQDANGKWSISVVHNYHCTRGICHHCFNFFEPRRWVIGPPDSQNPRGKPVLVDADPQYHIIRQIEATQPA